MKRKIFTKLSIILILFVWYLSGWPVIWQSPRIPPKIQESQAINKTNNWNFNGNSTGWSSTNDNGVNVCGDNSSSTADVAMATLAYSGSVGGQTAFQGITGTGKNIKGRGLIYQTVTAPGSGTVKAKGKFSYYGYSTAWNATGNTSWIRLDLFNSDNTIFVGSLGCVSFNSDQSWTTTSFSSNVDVTGGTVYTIRATLRGNNKNTNGSAAVTLAVDNIVVNFESTGLSVSAQAGTTNASLSWTTSTAGTGANGLHATTPYKVYRDTGSPVTTFLANALTNSYTDTSTSGNSTYYYAITDVDTAGDESIKSAEVSVLTLPAATDTPTFTNIKDATLTVNWSAPSGGAASYKIERCAGSGCGIYGEIRSGETEVFYNDSGLSGGTIYRYRVRATNATGDSAYSGIGETTTGIVSISVTSDGSVAYGFVAPSTSKDTTTGDTQTVRNTGDIVENFNIKSSNAIGGTQWTIGSAPDVNVFVHEFSTNGGGAWTKFTTADSYQTLATGIGASVTQNFDLKITTPTDSDTQQKTITITVQAVAQ